MYHLSIRLEILWSVHAADSHLGGPGSRLGEEHPNEGFPTLYR